MKKKSHFNKLKKKLFSFWFEFFSIILGVKYLIIFKIKTSWQIWNSYFLWISSFFVFFTRKFNDNFSIDGPSLHILSGWNIMSVIGVRLSAAINQNHQSQQHTIWFHQNSKALDSCMETYESIESYVEISSVW